MDDSRADSPAEQDARGERVEDESSRDAQAQRAAQDDEALVAPLEHGREEQARAQPAAPCVQQPEAVLSSPRS